MRTGSLVGRKCHVRKFLAAPVSSLQSRRGPGRQSEKDPRQQKFLLGIQTSPRPHNIKPEATTKRICQSTFFEIYSPMGRRVFIIGVGMTKFEKPGKRDWDYPDMGRIAAERALEDATISYKEIDQVACGYCYGDSTCGQRAVYQLGMTGVPVYNVNNNCSTGSTALHMAKQFVAGGTSECVMALGFEKMKKGSLGSNFNDRVNPIDKHFGVMLQLEEFEKGPPAAQMFGNAGREYVSSEASANCDGSRLETHGIQLHPLPPTLYPPPSTSNVRCAPRCLRGTGTSASTERRTSTLRRSRRRTIATAP